MTPVTRPQQAATVADSGISLPRLKATCATCSLRELCLPVGLSGEEMRELEKLVLVRRSVKRGEYLFRANDPFDSLYAVRAGFLKTKVLVEDGREQVTGFHMAGELIGLDGIGTERHACDAVALENSEVCVIPFERLEHFSREMEALQRHFHKVMSREIVREHGVMMLLGSMRAEERLAAFLLNLSQRLLLRGYSPTEFNLRMTRDEIGSYLGLKLETVSRALSRFQDEGLITVAQKNIAIKNAAGLRAVVGRGGDPC